MDVYDIYVGKWKIKNITKKCNNKLYLLYRIYIAEHIVV